MEFEMNLYFILLLLTEFGYIEWKKSDNESSLLILDNDNVSLTILKMPRDESLEFHIFHRKKGINEIIRSSDIREMKYDDVIEVNDLFDTCEEQVKRGLNPKNEILEHMIKKFNVKIQK